VNRLFQFLLIVSIILLSWFGMMAVHELGHCLAAWVSGGSVARVILHPLVISRTDFCRNPHPLFAAWGGFVVGALLPLITFAIAARAGAAAAYLFRFFAGFCLVLNGIYIAEDAFFRVADGGDLLRLETPRWVPVAAGAGAVIDGLALWNGLGHYFGMGEAKGEVSRRHAVGTACVCVGVAACEILLGW